MQPPVDTIEGQLVIKDLPDLACDSINSFAEMLVQLPRFLVPLIPATNGVVVWGPSEPSNSQTTKLWVRYNTAGVFVGFYIFEAGQWRLAYQPVGDNFNEIKWLSGDSDNPPDGWTLIDNTGPSFIPAGLRTQLGNDYYPTPGVPPYTFAAYVFTGY